MVLCKKTLLISLLTLSGTMFPMHRIQKFTQEESLLGDITNKKNGKKALKGALKPVDMNLRILKQFSFPSGHFPIAEEIARSRFFERVEPYDIATLPLESLETANTLRKYFENTKKRVIDVDRQGYNDIANLPYVIKVCYHDDYGDLYAQVLPDFGTKAKRVIVPAATGAVICAAGGAMYQGASQAVRRQKHAESEEELKNKRLWTYAEAYEEAYRPTFDARYDQLNRQMLDENMKEVSLAMFTWDDDDIVIAAVKGNPLFGLDGSSNGINIFEGAFRQSDEYARTEAKIEANKVATAMALVTAQAMVTTLPPEISCVDAAKFGACTGAFSGLLIGAGVGLKEVDKPVVVTAIPHINQKF